MLTEGMVIRSQIIENLKGFIPHVSQSTQLFVDLRHEKPS